MCAKGWIKLNELKKRHREGILYNNSTVITITKNIKESSVLVQCKQGTVQT